MRSTIGKGHHRDSEANSCLHATPVLPASSCCTIYIVNTATYDFTSDGAHHPSGDPTPSKADIEMTREVREAAERLGITLHDHVIISKSGHNSFKSLGLL